MKSLALSTFRQVIQEQEIENYDLDKFSKTVVVKLSRVSSGELVSLLGFPWTEGRDGSLSTQRRMLGHCNQ